MGDVVYSQSAISARLQAVASTLDAGGANGSLILLAGASPISTISLARPSGTVNGRVLVFNGTLQDPLIAASGTISGGRMQDSNGNVVVSGLTAGTSALNPAPDIILSTTTVSSGQSLLLTSVTIQGN
jgi:autotransporter translocation and assembly factor TamB